MRRILTFLKDCLVDILVDIGGRIVIVAVLALIILVPAIYALSG